MAINKKKSAAAAAVSLTALILWGVLAGLAACQNGMTSEIESLPVPPAVPEAAISGEASGSNATNYSFVLEWRRPDGLLLHNATYTLDTPENIAAMTNALDTWKEYVKLTDPLPGYQKIGADKVTTNVFASSGVLDNNQETLGVMGDMVIPRYWPRGTRGLQVIPSKAAWKATHTARVADFQEALAETEKMIAAIEGSALYNLQDPASTKYPLQELAAAMKDHIKYTDTTFADRTELDRPIGGAGGEGWIDPTKSGPLYEYYFGFIPDKGDPTWYADSSGGYAYE